MNCEYEYCIYNRDCLCILDKIEVNSFGMCDSCIIVELDKDFLTTEKERQLREISRAWESLNK